jgi:polyhydroxyalkanoate synthesis regulator phasin
MKLVLMAPMSLMLYELETKQTEKLVARLKEKMEEKTERYTVAQHVAHMDNLINDITELRNHLAKFAGKRLI